MTDPAVGYRTLVVPPERLREFREVASLAFPMLGDPLLDDSLPFALPAGRAVAVESADGAIVATHGSYPFTLPVPGGAVPCAGLTWVGVRPDHRRRGLMASMLRTHVERSLERGEVVSALFAAEAAIYGRFGYGSAADDVRLTLPRRAALRDVAGSADLTVDLVRFDAAVHTATVEDLYVRAGAGRPGWLARTPPELLTRVLADLPAARGGYEPLLLATVRRGDDVRGAALLARQEQWGASGPEYPVRVRQASALDAAATHRLWTFLLDLDLTATVSTPALAVDDPLLHLLEDPRPTQRRLGDNLWVRLLDVPAALGARRYATPVDVVLDLSDTLLPANAGRWRLEVDAAGAAQVSRTDARGDLRLDVRELGALYLGGRSASALAAAGLVDGERDVVDRVTVAFTSPLAPVCPWIF
ncbi:GNAT family N-acetyltransferase [Cellulomonas wangsupingiae]|uniref:GNAT family N-acetyltransferase n=1 Tax=Cellulomonas wangsupingiae TaxID=2968085 RepID=UPI001D0DC177|nr:GNAT family N-acetyltransferase [Cellulomonas wangsupingiae]MCM0638682.1 GNAT family N-acetyltransferase [Cellulomonas wangsupingiae]